MSIHYFGVQKFIAATRVFYSTFYIETNNIKFNFVNYNFFAKWHCVLMKLLPVIFLCC